MHTIANTNRQLPSRFRYSRCSWIFSSLQASPLSRAAHAASFSSTSLTATLASRSVGDGRDRMDKRLLGHAEGR